MKPQRAENVYLDQVMEKQAQVVGELKKKRKARPSPSSARRSPMPLQAAGAGPGTSPEVTDSPTRAVDYRITGFWRWKTVVVPPNAYVVHTRRGQKRPVNIGMGISFRFDPRRDAFLIIPAAMQTIVINANCICRELQGILVQAYVQWIIDDVDTAYRRLDFSDPEDPMHIVNVQLREQAEAAIKDKVATMSIDEVLSDKQPIIEELTLRLRGVAEGSRSGEEMSGLGLKIVTVQIKEAVVSSINLWENLQKPFRAERQKLARMAELEAQREIGTRELAHRKEQETEELATESELARLRSEQERERYDREQLEKVRRHQLEQEAEARALAERNQTELTRRETQLELLLKEHAIEGRRIESEMQGLDREGELFRARAGQERERLAAKLEQLQMRHQAKLARRRGQLELFGQRRQIENQLSDEYVRGRLIEQLPELARSLPRPDVLKSIAIEGGSDGALTRSLAGFVSSVMALVGSEDGKGASSREAVSEEAAEG